LILLTPFKKGRIIEKTGKFFLGNHLSEGYSFHGFVESGKLHLRTRRILLKACRQAYQIRPDTVMPYMIGTTEEVEKGLYLRRYGVPYEAIAHVLGHNAMYWYNATQALGRISIVGATVKEPSSFPPHLVADEKHSWWLGQRIYIAVTAAKECFLGVAFAHSADERALTQAYGEFQQEAKALNPDYCPETVNTDGWDATQAAWKTLFPGVLLMLCFLHTVLGVQQHCRRDGALYQQVTDKLWGLFDALNPRQFGQRLRRIQEWAKANVSHEIVLKKLLVQGGGSKNKFRTILRRFSDHSDYQELLSPLGVRL
jgi:hypothetical protein